MKKAEWITICGFSEQVGHFKAINFIGAYSYYYEYKIMEFYNVYMKLKKNVLFILNEEIQETTKYRINYEEDGLLNIFWKGSDKSKIQEVEIYKDFIANPSNLVYQSLYLSNYEHYYSIKVKKQSKYLLIYKSKDDKNNRTIYFDFTHNLGKKIGFKIIGSYAHKYISWIVYTSGTYIFYTNLNKNVIDYSNEF